MPPAMLVLQTRPSRLLGGGFSRVLRNSITIKMVLGIVLFFAGMSSLYVNHRLGLSLAGVGLVLVFVPAEFLFGLCIDFKGHKENARCSRSGSTKSDSQQPAEVVVEDGGGGNGFSASGDNASTFPPEVVLQEAGSGDPAGGSLQDGGCSPGADSRRTSSPRCTCMAGKNSPPDTSVQLQRTRSDVLKAGPGSTVDVRSEGSPPPADSNRTEATPSPTCKFHRTRSAVLRAEDLPKNAPPQIVRFNIGADGDDPAAAAASTSTGGVTTRTLSGGGRTRAAGGQSPRAALVRGVSFEQTTFHRSKSAVMHRGSLSGDEATAAMSSPSSSAKSSPTRSLRGQAAANTSPFRERPLAPAVARIQQLQQIPAMRIQSSKGGAAVGNDPRASTMAVQLYEAPFARTAISDLSNENYTRFHRIRAVQQQQQQQAAAVGAPGVTARKKEATSQNLLLRTRSMTTSRSSTNLAQPQQQDGPKTTGKPSKDKNVSSNQGAKGGSSSSDSSQRLVPEATTPKLRRTSSGPSRRPARASKEPSAAPWTSLAVQTAAGVITLLCKPQQQEAESASLLPPKPPLGQAKARETSRVPRIVTVTVSGDEDSSADREDSASSSGQRDSSLSLAQTSS